MSTFSVTTKLPTGRALRRPLALTLLALAAWSCSFPEYNLSGTSALPSDGGTAGTAAGATGTGGATGTAAGGAGAGGAYGSPAGGVGGSRPGPAGGGNAGASGSATVGSGSGPGNDGGAGGSSGAGGDGAGGAESPAKSCADYDDLPTDCSCHDYVGRAYLFCFTTRSWSQASSRCGFSEMALANIESPSEDAWVLKTAKAITDPRPLTFFWIGASSLDSPGTWHWSDGSIFWHGNASGSAVGDSYSNWRASSPQNTSGAACVFSDDHGWEDGDCTINRGYVCEAH